MIRQIVIWPDSVLARKCEPVTDFGPEFQQLLEDMTETMLAARGAGLAAPQVGFALRAVVVLVKRTEADGKAEVLQLVNPRIVEARGKATLKEGCLSLPGYFEEVERPESVVVEAQDREGKKIQLEGDGLLARALLHEIEHLDGRVFVQRLSQLKQRVARERFAKAKARGLRYSQGPVAPRDFTAR